MAHGIIIAQVLAVHGTTRVQTSAAHGAAMVLILVDHGITMDRISVCPGEITTTAQVSIQWAMAAVGAGKKADQNYTKVTTCLSNKADINQKYKIIPRV